MRVRVSCSILGESTHLVRQLNALERAPELLGRVSAKRVQVEANGAFKKGSFLRNHANCRAVGEEWQLADLLSVKQDGARAQRWRDQTGQSDEQARLT